MKITYAITVVDEFVEIQRLVTVLLENKRLEDEIVILFDSSREDLYVEEYLRAKSVNGAFSWHKGTFEGHFADWKNKLTSLCSGDYIFQIDADEYPHKSLITALPIILEANPDNDVYLVPRVNTVEGLTEQHISKWRWKINNDGWINYPDYQWRIWKNKPEIKWKNKVHEVLDGYKTYAPLPAKEELSLYHPKDIDRQEKQNAYYETLT
jgi:glycosyltransferase involved in cell wall biosynthesis